MIFKLSYNSTLDNSFVIMVIYIGALGYCLEIMGNEPM